MSSAADSIEGVGIGLRSPHVREILVEEPDIPWLEILADNHLARGGLVPRQLEALRSRYPIAMHCVGMSLGGTDPLDQAYLSEVRRVADRFEAAWVSDHVCFTAWRGRNFHDLLPLPYTEESLRHLGKRIRQAQDLLGRRILLENASSYLTFEGSTLSEGEFLAGLVEEGDCELLLDLNNLYVNQVNHGQSAEEVLRQLPLDRVRQIHLAGYEDKGEYLLDAHNNPVSDPVWNLYEAFVARRPEAPVLIEWDNDIPPLSRLREEAERADSIRIRALARAASAA